MVKNLVWKKVILALFVLLVGAVVIVGFIFQRDSDDRVVEDNTSSLSTANTTGTQPDESATNELNSQEQKIAEDDSLMKKDVLEETRKLLIALDKLPNNSTSNDVKDYVTPPLQSRPFIYYCDNNFVLQYVEGEYHTLEYYSSSFRKTDECEATFAIGSVQPNPASCSVSSTCVPVRDFIYPLTLKTDKSSYKYGDEIMVTLAGNENRDKTVELVGLVSPYCAGLYLERIGKSSQDWIRDSITLPKSGGGAGCPDNIIIDSDSPYELKIRIDNTGAVPPGKWRIVHESEFASLTAGFWLEPLNQEQFGCHVSGGAYVGCPASGGTKACIPCSCPEGFSWLPIEKQCLETAVVPSGYDADRIDVKYYAGTDVSNPITLIPKNLQDDVESIRRLAPAGGPEFLWLRFDLKTAADEGIFITQLRSLEWVESAEFAPLPAPPPQDDV